MSDFTRLENVLVKLRQRERSPGEGRKLRGPGVQALMASIVAEIDETVLPRRLVFTVDKNTELHLAVANRRLQALLSPVPEISGAQDLADNAFANGQDPNLETLGSVLHEAFEKAQTVSIHAHRQIAGGFDAQVGAPANALAKIWEIKDVPVRVGDPSAVLGSFLDQIGDDDAEAWLRIEGEDVTDQSGNAERLAALGEQAAIFLDGYFGKFEMLFGDEANATATVVSPGEAAQSAALFVEIGGMSAFVAANSGRVAALAAKWQLLVAE